MSYYRIVTINMADGLQTRLEMSERFSNMRLGGVLSNGKSITSECTENEEKRVLSNIFEKYL